MPYTKEDLDKMTPIQGPRVPITAIELNELYRPILQAWLDDHGVRPTCPACESPDYLLTMRMIPFAFAQLEDPWHIYIRLCRNCGHMLQFDLPVQITPETVLTTRAPSEADPPAR